MNPLLYLKDPEKRRTVINIMAFLSIIPLPSIIRGICYIGLFILCGISFKESRFSETRVVYGLLCVFSASGLALLIL